MFSSRKKQLESENKELKERVAYLESLSEQNGHEHTFVEVGRELLNGFHSSNGCSSEYDVTRICTTCNKKETKFELGF